MSRPLNIEATLQLSQSRLEQIQQQITADREDNSLLAETVTALALSLEELNVSIDALHQQNETLLATQQALEWQKQHYQNLFNFAPDAALITNERGIIQAANSVAEALLNVDCDLLIGKPLILFVAKPDHGLIYAQLKRLAQMAQPSSNPASNPSSFNPSSFKSAANDSHRTPAYSSILLLQDQEVSIKPRQREVLPASLALSGEYSFQQEWVLIWSFRNLQERQQAESTLQQREAFLSSIYNGANEAIFVIDVSNHNFYYAGFNALAEKYGGVSSQAAQGQTPEAVYGAVVGAAFRQNYERCLEAGTSISYEEHITFEARHLWTLTTLSPIRNSYGEIDRMIGTAIDITDRKLAEAELQTSRAKFEALVTNMPGMVYRYFPANPDRPHHFSFVSQHATQLLELAPETILQDANTFFNLIHLEDLPSFLLSVGHAVEHFLPWHWEGRIITPSGQLKWIQGNSQAQSTAEGEAWDGLLVDISDRKLAEQKIQEQAALLDIASDAIFVRDLNNRILYWNQGAEQLYGWSATEAIGQFANELLQNNEVQVETIIQKLLDQDEWRGEIQNVTKAGKQVTVEARWTLVRDEAGEPKFILTVNTDVTEQKQLEAQFYRAQRLESLGTLASGIAHDLNNVLTPILAISQLLRSLHANSDDRSQEMLKILEDSAKRGATMIQQILTFTRGTGSKRQLIQVAPILQEVKTVIQQTFPRTIQIVQHVPEQASWLISANSTYLHQVFMNLCVNARDAMPDGGTLSLAIEPCFVDQAFAQANLEAQVGDYVVVTVADTGLGIPLEARNHIFEPFFTTKPLGQGTGLGLASVLGIVKDYGGFLQVFSEVGQGTQVKVYLPIAPEIVPAASRPQQPFDANGELILLVDDDVAVQCSTQSLLESYHYTVLSTTDGLEAIELYAQHQAEIKGVILDIMMPNISGTLLIQKLKVINPRVQIIAMSGLLSNREPALAAGATIFLPKPYTLEDLLQNLQVLITQSTVT